MTDQQHSSLKSLEAGHWFKLICGASFQHLPAVRNLALAYTLAGTDCIDVAADLAVITAAREGVEAAMRIKQRSHPEGLPVVQPLLMVSLNDGEDPHFRKAEFMAENCPADCPRPCEMVCSADAIALSGVISDRCYGCGRCLLVCPIQHISARSYVSTPQAIAPLILEAGVDALEIHTRPGCFTDFQRLWQAVKPWIGQLKLLAISCPDGEGLIDYLKSLYDLIAPLPCPLIWQTDGRPMSGDIGIGTTKATIRLGQKVLQANLPGYVQLAGGTNHHTVPKLRSLGLLQLNDDQILPLSHARLVSSPNNSDISLRHVAGVAYGSYARVLLSPILEQLEVCKLHPAAQTVSIPSRGGSTVASSPDVSRSSISQPLPLELAPELLEKAVDIAYELVSQIKPFQKKIPLLPESSGIESSRLRELPI